MKSLDRAFIDDLLSRVDIVEIIGQSVQLKKHGSGHKGLCPFHAENTPSFNVSSTKQFYHCFGCGASGDAIKFLREHDGLTFMEAIEKLAKIANVEIPQLYNTQSNNYKNLINVNNTACERFKENLLKSTLAKEYLYKRGINDEMINLFNIGLASNGWDDLTKLFTAKNQIKAATDTGLIINKNTKNYDRFRNRIMFPIKNTSGNIIAFGGRTLDKNENAKYINSPESEIFHKSNEMYGLFEAKSTISKKNHIIIVEGYTDVIALHKNNFNNAVATLGTAFTKNHITKLLRYTKNIIFCFDGDDAGKKAAWKALENCLTEIRDDTNIYFTFIRDNMDPDDLCNTNLDKFKDILESKISLSEFMLAKVQLGLNLNNVEDKTHFVNTIRPLINSIPDGLYKSFLQDEVIKITNVKKSLLTENIQKNTTAKSLNNDVGISDILICKIFIEYPSLIEKYGDKIIKLVSNENIIQMLKLLKNMKSASGYRLNSFLNESEDIKNIFLKLDSSKKTYESIKSAELTLNDMLSNKQKSSNENLYHTILNKYTDNKMLTEEEKNILKNFKK